MITLIALFLATPSMAGATTVISFAAHARRCEIRLARAEVTDDRTSYKVERLELPLRGLAYRAFQFASLFQRFDLGEAVEVHGRGIGNRFAGLDGLLLKDIVEGPADADPYRMFVAEARARITEPDAKLMREAYDFARGADEGRALVVTLRAIMPGGRAAQQQRVLVLLPRRTYPAGVILSGSGTLPTFRPLMNVAYGDSAGAMIWAARITEPENDRPPFVKAVEYRPRRGLPPRRPARIIE